MEFNKVFEDIFNSYKDEVVENNLLSLDDLNSINKIFYKYLKSYYFENLYDSAILKQNTEGYLYPLLINNSELDNNFSISGNLKKWNEILNFIENKELLDFFKVYDIQKFIDYKNLNNEVWETFNYNKDDKIFKDSIILNEFEKNVINKLKQLNNFYSIIFENNEIKQSLNLKNKKDFNFKVIDLKKDGHNNINSVFELFNKVPCDNIKKLLLENYGFKFIKNVISTKKLVIAHNQFEISGIIVVDNSYALKRMEIIDFDNFDYNCGITVGKSFRGYSLGIKMFDVLANNVKENNNILLNSQATVIGDKYIKNNLSNFIKNNKDKSIVMLDEDEKDDFGYRLIEILFKNKSLLIDDLNNNLISQKELDYNSSKDFLNEYINKIRNSPENKDELIKELFLKLDYKKENKNKIKVN
jgi:hypothetical protein